MKLLSELVTIITQIPESRLLPDPASVSVDSNGNPVIFKAISEGLDEHTLLYLPFYSNAADQSSYKCSVSALEDGMLFIDPNHKKFGEASLGMSGDSSSSTAKKLIATLNAPLANSDFTIHGWIRVTDEYYQRALFTFQETGNNGKYESGDYSSNCFSVVFWEATRILLVHFSGNGDANLNYAGADIQNVNLNEWVHVAFTRSANTFFVFVNGKLTITKSATESLPEYIAIGNYGGSESAIHNINGNIDEFIILNYAKWTEDFDVPTQPASTLVKSYGVSDKTPVTSDSPRLLPENPANGDIPCFDATAAIGGGNDETVKFLLQPATTDGELIDSAAGAVTPATITNHSLTVSESGEIEFSSSKYATVPASGILADVLRHDKPWVFDLLVYLDQTSSQSRFFGTESGGDFFCQWTGDYGFDFKYGDTWISTLTGNVGEWNLLTLEYYQKNGTWHVALYLQGVLCQDKEISTSFDPKTSELAIGRSTSGSYLCSGKIRAIRIREGALYNGQSFTPDEFPYQEPQTVGEWGKLNKNELVIMPDGGQDGQTLVKSGNSVVWGEANITVDATMSDTSTNPVQNKVVKAAIDANKVTVDSELSDTSTNPVQNKVVKAALDGKGSGGIFYQNVFQSESIEIYLNPDYPIYQYTLLDTDNRVDLLVDNIDLTKGCITVELQLTKPVTNTNSITVRVRNKGTSSAKTVKWLDSTQSITTQGTYSIVIRTFDGTTWYANIAYLI